MAEPEPDSFGALLRGWRERAGLTQEELAERAALTAHAVSALERGTRTRPYPHTVRSLAAALDLDAEEQARLVESVPRRVRRPEQPGFPPSPAPEVADGLTPPRLDVPATPLHGRTADVAAVAELVGAGRRLVTLTGLGGVGKTRLAVAVAERLAGGHPDGVAVVPLAAVTDADAVLPGVARAVGLSASGPGALDLIAAHLADQRLLLVVDNAEHLLSAAPDLATLVARCPTLTVLVTSRAALRVRGEHEYAVAPLRLPDPDAHTREALGAAPSGALVLDRVAALGREPTEADVPALAALCHRLAGLPLALELASAQLRHLAAPDLLARLDQVVDAAGARDLPERQRTLRATLDWSHGLLDPEEQLLFRVLGAFRGGATLEPLERVAADGTELAPEAVLPLLDTLVAHSLVVARGGPDGVRYHLLEPVAQYAHTLLLGEEAGRVFRAHAAWFRTLAGAAAAGYEGDQQVAWLRRIELEEANLLLAVDRSLDLGDAETAAWTTWWMWLYWWLRGQLSVGRRRAERCLETELPPAVRGRAHLAAATMCYAAGDVAAAGGHWTEAARLGAQTGDDELACKGVAGLGLASLAGGALDASADHFRDAIVVGERAGEPGRWLVTLAHVWLGTVLMLQGRPDDAAAETSRGLALARERGDRLATYIALFSLAQAALAAGDRAAARAHLEEGVVLSGQTRDRSNLAYVAELLAVVESGEGRHERVATLLGAGAALREAVGAGVYGYYLPDETLRAAAEQAALAALGQDAYDDAADAGRALDVDGVVRFSLER